MRHRSAPPLQLGLNWSAFRYPFWKGSPYRHEVKNESTHSKPEMMLISGLHTNLSISAGISGAASSVRLAADVRMGPTAYGLPIPTIEIESYKIGK